MHPGAINVHGDVSSGEPRTLALRSGTEYSSDLPTEGCLVYRLDNLLVLVCIGVGRRPLSHKGLRPMGGMPSVGGGDPSPF